MKYLIDTHIFIWSVLNSSKLPSNIKNIIEDYSNEIIVSAITFWEISIKTQLGKFDFGNFDISLLPHSEHCAGGFVFIGLLTLFLHKRTGY